MDALEYKSVVVGLMFFIYFRSFEEKYRVLVEEGDGFEEDIDEYTSEGIFFVPANARWSIISEAAHTPEIGTVIDEAIAVLRRKISARKISCPKTLLVRNWTSAAWAMW